MNRTPPPPPCVPLALRGRTRFACIAAGIASLWGPAHGGANEAALKMLEEISSVKHIPEFVRRAKDKMTLSA